MQMEMDTRPTYGWFNEEQISGSGIENMVLMRGGGRLTRYYAKFRFEGFQLALVSFPRASFQVWDT